MATEHLSRKAHILLNVLSVILFITGIVIITVSWSRDSNSELYPPSSYPYRFQIEEGIEFSQANESQDYSFALIPADSTLDTMQVRIHNGAPRYSYVDYIEFFSGKYRGESSKSDSTCTLLLPLLIECPDDYPDLVIPVMYEYKSPQVWYLKNTTREISPPDSITTNTTGKSGRRHQWTLIESDKPRVFEPGGPVHNIENQEVGLLAGGDLDPRLPGSELVVQVTLVNRDKRKHRSQIRCYHLDSWRELWRFDVPSGVVMYQGLEGDSGTGFSHLFVLRGDYQGNDINGMVDSTSYILKLDLDGRLLTKPLPLGSPDAAWHIESSYPLPGTNARFLMYGYEVGSEYSFLEIRDAVTLQVISHQQVGFSEGCHLLPSKTRDVNSFQVLLYQNQVNFQLYDERLQLQGDLSLSAPFRVLLWMPELRGSGFDSNGTHILLGGVNSGRLLLLDPDLKVLSADRIQNTHLSTLCTRLIYQSVTNPLRVIETDRDTWFLNFHNKSLKGHFTRRPMWFLSAIKNRHPGASLLMLASILTYLFGHIYLLRLRWHFYSTTVNTLFRNSLDAILIFDSRGKVLALNQVFRELIGVSEDAIGPDTNRTWRYMLHKSPPGSSVGGLFAGTQLEKLHLDATTGGKTSGTIELLKENQPVTYSYRFEEMQSRGAVQSSILILQDITQQLEETKRTIWKFMAQNTAHRLKSPLQRIKTVAESTLIKRQRDKLDMEEVGDNLQKILNTTRDINQIIHDFLMVSDRKIKPRQLDLRAFLMKNIQYYRQKNLTESIQLKLVLADNLPPVMADDYHLLTLLVNLLDNSLKAVQGEGQIIVSAEPISDSEDPRQQWLRLQVQDDGIGIPSEVLPKIFQHHESFFRDGHGIGLAVVYSIVQAHEGRISVASEPGEGTVFQVDLPLMEQSLQ